jgi:hypothetical protein
MRFADSFETELPLSKADMPVNLFSQQKQHYAHF